MQPTSWNSTPSGDLYGDGDGGSDAINCRRLYTPGDRVALPSPQTFCAGRVGRCTPVATALDVEPGETRRFTGRQFDITVSWRLSSTNGSERRLVTGGGHRGRGAGGEDVARAVRCRPKDLAAALCRGEDTEELLSWLDGVPE